MKKIILVFSLFIFLYSCEKKVDKIEPLNYEITEISTFEQDQETLLKLFEVIKILSKSRKCNNANDWIIVGYGSKACGGFQGYIAYAKSINEADFLNKLNLHIKLEDKYNKKHGIFSPCDVTPAPKSVECVNEKPKFIY